MPHEPLARIHTRINRRHYQEGRIGSVLQRAAWLCFGEALGSVKDADRLCGTLICVDAEGGASR